MGHQHEAPIKTQEEAGQRQTNPFDEVKEIVSLQHFDSSGPIKLYASDRATLEDAVAQQLRDYVASIAVMYHNNHFHNFEHASRK